MITSTRLPADCGPDGKTVHVSGVCEFESNQQVHGIGQPFLMDASLVKFHMSKLPWQKPVFLPECCTAQNSR